MGEISDVGDLPRIAPMTSTGWWGGGQEAGFPPQGGVQDLVFTQDANGKRSMDYTYKGASYYMRYIPSEKPGCYTFETRTVTDGGKIKAGEYCR